MTEAEEIAVAEGLAMRLAKQWNRPLETWREYLADAWFRVRQASCRGLTRMQIILAGHRGIIDGLRRDNPDPSRSRHVKHGRGRGFISGAHIVAFADDETPVTLFESIPAAEAPLTPAERLQFLWYDTRQRRAVLSHLKRLWLYLTTVEGWQQRQIAETWGVTQSAVSLALSQAVERLGRTRTQPSLATEC